MSQSREPAFGSLERELSKYEEGNNVREDAMAEQIRLSLVLSASFRFIIEHHMMGKQRQTLTDHVLFISAH